MHDQGIEAARRIWRERKFPVLMKPISGKLKVRFPNDLIQWPFRVGPKELSPKLLPTKKYWEVPRTRFKALVPDLVNLWGKTHIIQYFTEQKQCAKPCREAKGYDCECTCGGEFHGIDGPPGKWLDITDTFSVAVGETYLSCRLLVRKGG